MANNLGNKRIMAENIKRFLAKNNMNRKELSECMGVPYTTVCSWVSGDMYPRIDKIEKMAQVFGVSKANLIEEDIAFEQPTPPAKISDKDIMFALLDGDKYEEIPDEVFNEVKEFAQWIAEKKMREQK